MAKPDLNALNDPARDFELVEPRTKGFWLSFGSGVFVAIGVWMITSGDDDPFVSWGVTLFFGLCLLVGLMKLFGKPDTIRFDQQGFTYTSLNRPNRMEWTYVTEFGVYRVGGFFGNQMVGMNLSQNLQSAGTGMAQAIAGFDGALPTTYGVKPEVLAAAMQKRMLASQSRR